MGNVLYLLRERRVRYLEQLMNSSNLWTLKKSLIEQFLAAYPISVADLKDYCQQINAEIYLVWTITDVHQVNQQAETPYPLSDDDAWLILQTLAAQHDANVGVCWHSLGSAIEVYCHDKTL